MNTAQPVTSSLLKVVLFWGAYLLILFLASIPKGMVPPGHRGVNWGEVLWGSLAVPALLLLTARFNHDGLPASGSDAIRSGPSPVWWALAGVLIGVASYAATILAISAIAGPLHLVAAARPAWWVMLATVATVTLLAYMEELGFRGYPLRTLLRTLGPWPAHALVALAFGLSHVAFGWSMQRIVFGVIPSALLFGAAAHLSGGLAMPTAVHAAINLVRVTTGETERAGLWTLTYAPADADRLAQLAPYIAATVTLISAAVLFTVRASWRPSR